MRTGLPISDHSRFTNRSRARTPDAIELLQADHRQLEVLFSAFDKAQTAPQKGEIARRICHAVKVHSTIEEEFFHPAFLDATGEADVHHEAEVEHAGVRNLIRQLEAGGHDDEYFDAGVAALAESVRLHVMDEEKSGGMFAAARRSGMDLKFLGRQMLARKSELDCAIQ